jgi:regulator of PEP synthase PpsR (kinase-PPPase family)
LNSQGASTSLSSESTIEIISQAVLKALKEAHHPDGCMHYNQDEDEKKANKRMVKIGEEVVVNTMSVLQESVHKSINNNLPIIQDGIRGEIRDSLKAMQKLI